jgi:hypothetical protein
MYVAGDITEQMKEIARCMNGSKCASWEFIQIDDWFYARGILNKV